MNQEQPEPKVPSVLTHTCNQKQFLEYESRKVAPRALNTSGRENRQRLINGYCVVRREINFTIILHNRDTTDNDNILHIQMSYKKGMHIFYNKEMISEEEQDILTLI